MPKKPNHSVIKKSHSDDESLKETLYLLSNSNNRKHLLKAIKNKGKGKCVSFKSKKEIDRFFAEL